MKTSLLEQTTASTALLSVSSSLSAASSPVLVSAQQLAAEDSVGWVAVTLELFASVAGDHDGLLTFAELAAAAKQWLSLLNQQLDNASVSPLSTTANATATTLRSCCDNSSQHYVGEYRHSDRGGLNGRVQSGDLPGGSTGRRRWFQCCIASGEPKALTSDYDNSPPVCDGALFPSLTLQESTSSSGGGGCGSGGDSLVEEGIPPKSAHCTTRGDP